MKRRRSAQRAKPANARLPVVVHAVELAGEAISLDEELRMRASCLEKCHTIGPKRRQRHYSYNETLDESAQLIADEPADVEREAPAEAAEPVERIDENGPVETPAFEE